MVVAGFIVLGIAGLFQGSFGLGMKKYQPFSWEAFWAVYSILGMVLVPFVWTAIEVPGFMNYLRQTPMSIWIPAAVCGLFWGITAIGFGKAIDILGMSLTYGIAMGVSAVVGALFPLFMGNTTPNPRFLTIMLIGTAVMLVGVGVITKAGIMKDKEMQQQENKNDKFTLGLILAFISGLGSAANNIGFAYANYPSQLAVADGVNATSASQLAWLVVFSGGFIANFGYALILLVKNRTFSNYMEKGCGIAYGKALITAAMWLAALFVYGKATVLLGVYGPVVGWICFNALALIISNAWGIRDGEWKGHEKPKKVMILANLILIISWVIMGIANGMA